MRDVTSWIVTSFTGSCPESVSCGCHGDVNRIPPHAEVFESTNSQDLFTADVSCDAPLRRHCAVHQFDRASFISCSLKQLFLL